MDEYAYVVNVDCAVVRDGEYLLVERAAGEEHAAGLLAFPGGKVESPPGTGDALRATARRELREEVGVDVADPVFVTSGTFEADDGTHCLNAVLYGEYAGGDAHPNAPGEVAAVYWLPPEKIQERENAPPYLLEYVDRVEDVRNG